MVDTQNKMVFRQCSFEGDFFSHSMQESGRNAQDSFTFPRDKDLLMIYEKDPGEVGMQANSVAHLFMLTMAACNTVNPEVPSTIAIETPLLDHVSWQKHTDGKVLSIVVYTYTCKHL